MPENLVHGVDEAKRLIQWIGNNSSDWDMVCGNVAQADRFFDCIQTIKDLRENKFYSQILSLACTQQCGIDGMAINAVIEEIIENCNEDWMNRVIDRIILKLNEAHQSQKQQRVDENKNLQR